MNIGSEECARSGCDYEVSPSRAFRVEIQDAVEVNDNLYEQSTAVAGLPSGRKCQARAMLNDNQSLHV